MPESEDELLTVAEIAERLKLNQQTVRNWIDAGKLPAIRVGRRVRVQQSALDEFMGMQDDEPTQAPAGPPAPAFDHRAAADALDQIGEGFARLAQVLRNGPTTRGGKPRQ
jgi:excisionase family DNA binding protein